MKIAIIGSRNFPHKAMVKYFVEMLPHWTIVVSGHSPGGGPDIWAEEAAEKHCSVKPEIYPIPPTKNRQEFIYEAMARNKKIAEACEVVVAFWDRSSNGTRHTLNEAMTLGKPVFIISPEDNEYQMDVIVHTIREYAFAKKQYALGNH